MSDFSQLLEHAKGNTSGRGIFTASRYLSDIAGCLTGGACPSQMWSLSSADEWEKTLGQSVQTLTATDTDWTFDEKSFTTEKGYILVASGIMSTSKMDSDRDILESKGAQLEAVCPYLWHHMPAVPVGKVLGHSISTTKSGDKDIDAVLFKCGILDVGNGLGRDTALLIEMGALRNSHGFEPLEAKPIKGAGWHVTKYRTFEISGVTIPANSDSVFTEYSKEKSKFKSDAVRNWIKGHYDERAKTFSGWVAPTQEPLESTKTAEACSCKKEHKETPELAKPIKAEKFYLPGLPGSWEDVQSELRKQARSYIRESLEDEYYGGYIESTFGNYVILCAYSSEDGSDCYYKVSWKMVNGKPVLMDDAVEIDIAFSATITESVETEDEKSAEVNQTKAFHQTSLPVQGTVESEVSRVVDPVLASLGL